MLPQLTYSDFIWVAETLEQVVREDSNLVNETDAASAEIELEKPKPKLNQI